MCPCVTFISVCCFVREKNAEMDAKIRRSRSDVKRQRTQITFEPESGNKAETRK